MKTGWLKRGLHALIGTIFLVPCISGAATTYHRVVWDRDPSSTAIIAFSPNGTSNSPYVTYGYSTNEVSWTTQSVSDSQTFASSLTTHFVRLSGLTPNSAVYYRVCDQDGCGDRFWFKTAPNDNSPYVVVAGGDTRTGWDTRRAGNDIIAKIRPLFVMHGGDFTNSNNYSEMTQFLVDWARTYSSDTIDGYSYKRIYPVVPTHGNHEDGDFRTLCRVFGVDSNNNGSCDYDDNYNAFNVSPLLRVYTLNSQFQNSGWSSYATAQNNFLSSDLAANGTSATWRIAQYHKPMFPHTSGKSDNPTLHTWWADEFYNNAMNLVVESDSHVCKETEALVPSGSNFVSSTNGGTVYVGEGSWGAPARSADDPKSWTIDLASIQQFKVITVSGDKMEVRTAQFDTSASALTRTERENNATILPANVNWWSANEIGETMTLTQNAQNLSIIDTGSTGGGTGTTTTVDANEDTFISSTQNTTNLNGSADQLLADGSDTTYGEMMTLIKFDVSSVQQCATVSGATVKINVFNPSSGTYGIHSAASSWSDSTATWDSVGGSTVKGTQLATFNPSSTGLVSVALNSSGVNTVNGWVQGTNNGIVIASTGATDGIDMNDIESGNGTVLELTVDDSACGSASQNVAPTAAFSASTSDLTVTLTDGSTDSDGSIASWSWDFGDGDTSTLQNPNHTYTAAGTYTVTLTVTDNEAATDSTNHPVTVTAPSSGGTILIEVRVNQSTDDAEERISDGNMYTDSSDLEFVYDSYVGGDQVVGIRFQNVDIPHGAIITSAYLQFAVDETGSEATTLTLQAQDSDDADTFSTTAFDISARPKTTAFASWSPAAWSTTGTLHNTSGLTSVVQEVVDRSGWTSGNDMAFMISGNGKRTAESYDGSSSTAPLLHVEYELPPVNQAPVITNSNLNIDIAENQTMAMDVNATDADDDTLTYSITGGSDAAKFDIDPATGLLNFIQAPDFENPDDSNTDHVYTVNIEVTDGTDTDSVTVTVTVTDVAETFVQSDFNGDGYADILFKKDDGSYIVQLMDASGKAGQIYVLEDRGWNVEAVADFDGNSYNDILFKEDTGALRIQFFNAEGKAKSLYLMGNRGWSVQGAGDFNNDHKTDILFRKTDGTLIATYIDNTGKIGQQFISKDRGREVKSVADFDGNGYADILFNLQDGTRSVWYMNATGLQTNYPLTGPALSVWSVKGTGDFNHDGNADILFQKDDTTHIVWLMDGTGKIGKIDDTTTLEAQAVGDYNGDGDADIVFRRNNGSLVVTLMSTSGSIGTVFVMDDKGWTVEP